MILKYSHTKCAIWSAEAINYVSERGYEIHQIEHAYDDRFIVEYSYEASEEDDEEES
jgi:hypothetical protein